MEGKIINITKTLDLYLQIILVPEEQVLPTRIKPTFQQIKERIPQLQTNQRVRL